MPRDITVTFGDGTTHVYQNAPDDVTPDAVQTRAEKQFAKTVTGIDGGRKATQAEPDTSVMQDIKQGAGNLLAGAVRGAGSIGATILAPYDMAKDAIAGKGLSLESNRARRQDMDDALANPDLPVLGGAQPDSLMYKGGKLAGEIAGTAGAGGAAANVLTKVAPAAAKAAPAVFDALRSGGMSANGATGIGGMAARVVGGAASGGLSAGLANPEDAPMGMAAGAAAPVALKAVGAAAEKVGQGVRSVVGGRVSQEVADLAKRAKQLGVDIPADRLVDSRPLNAVAAGLNYVPFSGRQATEDLMTSQLNRAVSKTFGQDSSNVTAALRRAGDSLGAQFDHTLRNTGVQVDKQFLDGVAAVYNKAEKELGTDALKPIAAQIDELVSKGASGTIDGQAAYNIKRTLDRIGKQNTPTAYHALELKGELMDALNRSLGPDKAANFAKVREQYGNMLALEKLAKNGAEGEISVARLANMQNINNKPLQEIADIAAQFVKPREGQHGAAQRALAGALTFGMGGAPAVAAGAAGGRTANAVLNSDRLKALMLGEKIAPSALGKLLTKPATQDLITRSAPILASDR
jgi:hypothetical protein